MLLNKKESSIADALRDAMLPLEDIREKISELTERRNAVGTNQKSRAETLSTVRELIEVRAAHGKELIDDFAHAAQYNPFRGDLVPFSISADQVRVSAQSLLCFLNKDSLLAELEAAVERSVPADRPGLKEASLERERIDKEIFALGVREEHVIRALEAAGLAVNRRADALPEIVLSDDPEKVAA
jgi:hypothetical protein